MGVAISVYFHYKKKVQNTRLQMHKLSKLKEEQEAKSMKAHEENICKIKELEQKLVEQEGEITEKETLLKAQKEELEQAKALQNLLLAQKEELEAKNKEIIACLKNKKFYKTPCVRLPSIIFPSGMYQGRQQNN